VSGRAGGPLAGVLVVDLTRFMAGPYGTQLLAYLGADVVKIEEPGRGDPMRGLSRYSQNGLSAHFASGNSSKRSVTLDLRSDEGKRVFLDLVARADVVMENFRPGTLERLGLGYDTLREVNPRLVFASVTGFGQSGPWAGWPSYDLIAQAIGGTMSLTGEPGRPPVKMGVPIGDLAGGVLGALGVVAALYRRERSGAGEAIDVSMLDAQLSLLNYHAHFWFASGEVPQAEGDGHPNLAPYRSFETASGRLVVAVYGDPFWPGFCRALDAPELIDDPRFARNELRLANRPELEALVERRLRERPREEWQERFVAEGVPAGPLNSVADAVRSVQALAREMIVDVDGPDGEPMRVLGNPIKVRSGTPVPSAPPALGRHTDDVLAGLLGYDRERIAALHEAGIV
jgi:formyl-CoA transferase/CoA:oxalate CoA-transferase